MKQAAKILKKQIAKEKKKALEAKIGHGKKVFKNVGEFINRRQQKLDLTEESEFEGDQIEDQERVDENPQFNLAIKEFQQSDEHLLSNQVHLIHFQDSSDSEDETTPLQDLLKRSIADQAGQQPEYSQSDVSSVQIDQDEY